MDVVNVNSVEVGIPIPVPVAVDMDKRDSRETVENSSSTGTNDITSTDDISQISWSSVGTLSFGEGLSISLSYNLGLSLLVFSFHIARAGLGGFMIYAFAMVTTYTTAGFIAEIMYKYPEIQTYSDIGLKAARCVFGLEAKNTHQLVLTFFRVFQQFELFMYLIFDFLIIEQSLVELDSGLSELVRHIISCFILFPMVIFTLRPRWLSRSGIISTLSFESLYALIVITGIRALNANESRHSLGFSPESIKGFYGSYGGILLMFSGHAIYPSVFAELQDKKDMFRVLNYTYGFLSILCIPIAAVIIMGYGRENITDLPTGYLEEGTIENWIGQILMILKGTFTHPAIFYPIVTEVSQIIHVRYCAQSSNHITILDAVEEQRPLTSLDRSPSMKLKIVVSLVISILAFIGSLLIPSIAFVLSITSAIFAISLNLTLPSLTFAVIMSKEDYPFRIKIAILLFFVGLASSVVSLLAL